MTQSSNKNLLVFPCEFPIKIFGKTSLEFETTVLTIVRKHAPDLSETATSINPSSNKKYLAITVLINAKSQTQLDALYQDLSTHKDVLMVL